MDQIANEKTGGSDTTAAAADKRLIERWLPIAALVNGGDKLCQMAA
jgi:hypothetical protein